MIGTNYFAKAYDANGEYLGLFEVIVNHDKIELNIGEYSGRTICVFDIDYRLRTDYLDKLSTENVVALSNNILKYSKVLKEYVKARKQIDRTKHKVRRSIVWAIVKRDMDSTGRYTEGEETCNGICDGVRFEIMIGLRRYHSEPVVDIWYTKFRLDIDGCDWFDVKVDWSKYEEQYHGMKVFKEFIEDNFEEIYMSAQSVNIERML